MSQLTVKERVFLLTVQTGSVAAVRRLLSEGHSPNVAAARPEITPLHERSLGTDVVKPWRDRAANPQAREAVARLRRGTQELYASLGGVSWQVARDYPFREILSDGTWSLLCDIKKAVDPRTLMNPGSLGLTG